MKSFMVLLLSFLIIENVKNNTFSINDFINSLQEQGYYDIIIQLKKYFGDDIAIEFCIEFTKSNQCEEVVKVYINYYPNIYSFSNPLPNYSIKKGAQENKIIEPVQNGGNQQTIQKEVSYMKNIKELPDFIYREEIYEILIKYYTKEEIELKVQRIIKKFEKNVLAEPDLYYG